MAPARALHETERLMDERMMDKVSPIWSFASPAPKNVALCFTGATKISVLLIYTIINFFNNL